PWSGWIHLGGRALEDGAGGRWTRRHADAARTGGRAGLDLLRRRACRGRRLSAFPRRHRRRAGGSVRLLPVPVPAPVFDDYYRTISNEILWMLQHRLLRRDACRDLQSPPDRAWDEGYLEANRRLADAIGQSRLTIRALLVQDYH